MARFEHLDEAADWLASRGSLQLPFTPEWLRLEDGHERPVAAVDGSHAVLLDNGVAWVVAERAIAAHWPGNQAEPAIRVHAASPDNAQQQADAAYQDVGLQAPTIHGADSFAEAMRALSEYRAAKEAIKALPSDGLLLLDGALERLPRHANQLVEGIIQFAGDRHVVGVAKRSKLDADGTPLVPALQKLAKAEQRQTWMVEVPGYTQAVVACLHPQGKHAFRIDATHREAIADLVPLCKDAVYTGYPYPLAVAHNAVAITHAQARNMRSIMAQAVAERGDASIMADFHDILDQNAPR